MSKCPIDINDPRLIDFVLGELAPREAAELAEALQRPENHDALRETEALQAAVRASQNAFRNETAIEQNSLTQEQRKSILDEAQQQAYPNIRRVHTWMLRLSAAAAIILLCFGAFRHYMREIRQEKGTRVASNRYSEALPAPAAETDTVYNESPPKAAEMPKMTTLEPLRAPLTEKASRDGNRKRSGDLSQPASSPATPDSNTDASIRAAQSTTLFLDENAEDIGYSQTASLIIPPPLPPRWNGESYATLEEQPFTRVDEAPLSTFSLHPDTAAYTNIRRFLKQGRRPPKDAVRIEELINYFSYDYPQPTGEHPFSVTVEVAECPWASGHLLAKIGLQGRSIPPAERPSANLIFLIDTSGSMQAPNRLPLVQESLKALVEVLAPEDRVGIVTYAGNSQVALNSTPVSEKERILRVIDSLTATGSTHGSAGIEDAYQLAQQNHVQGGINRVLLATDGDFNVGVTTREGLLALVEEKRNSGTYLTVLGYGMGNLKDANLETLATKGNGNYAYIDSYGEARRVLVEQVTGTLMTIAKDTKIQVEFNPAQVRSYRLIGFENRYLAHRDFNDDTKDAGEIGAGHSVTALYQLVPVGMPVEPGIDDLRYQEQPSRPLRETAGNTELLFVKLRYKRPDNDTSTLLERPVTARTARLAESSDDFRFSASVAAFGLLLRDSEYKGQCTFDLAHDLAVSALNEDPKRNAFLDLIVTAKTQYKR